MVKHKNNQVIGGVLYKGLYIIATSFNALLMIKILSPKELGIWYVFMTLQTLIFILNNALIPNISRQYSLGLNNKNYIFNCYEFHSKTNLLFIRLVLIVLFICFSVTFLYLSKIISIFSYENRIILASWIIIAFSLCFEVYYTSYDCAFNGIGEFTKVHFANFISRSILSLLGLLLIVIDIHQYSLLLFCVFLSIQ